jgi:hypothetical protein
MVANPLEIEAAAAARDRPFGEPDGQAALLAHGDIVFLTITNGQSNGSDGPRAERFVPMVTGFHYHSILAR